MKVLILRGLCGSGKTTYVQKLQKEHEPGMVVNCCADDFFMVNGEYKFDPTKLGEAHKQCFKKFVDVLLMLPPYDRFKKEVVCVSNTLSSLWEISPYISFARAYDIPCEIIHLKCSVETSLKRNVHNVPRDVIERMEKHWQKLPKSFGTETIIETD